MRTSADEVSIHALSPESTFRASSACASGVRTHQYPAPKDRCLLSIVPPEVEEIVSNGGATTRRGGSTGKGRARARNGGHRCPVSGHGLLFVQRQARLGAGAQPPEVVAVPERDAGGHDEHCGLAWCPRGGFPASVDPGPAAGVLAPPSCGVALATPRRSSLRSPASAPRSTLSRPATSRTPHWTSRPWR